MKWLCEFKTADGLICADIIDFGLQTPYDTIYRPIAENVTLTTKPDETFRIPERRRRTYSLENVVYYKNFAVYKEVT